MGQGLPDIRVSAQNRAGKTRLAKYYVPLGDGEKHSLEYDVHRLISTRDPKFTNFVEVKSTLPTHVSIYVAHSRPDHKQEQQFGWSRTAVWMETSSRSITARTPATLKASPAFGCFIKCLEISMYSTCSVEKVYKD